MLHAADMRRSISTSEGTTVLKKILTIIAMLYAVASFAAAVDANKATEAELDSIRGIGPGISAKILQERTSNGDFKDWNDFINRVSGVGEKSAARFSGEGLTVSGKKFKASGRAKQANSEKKEARKKKDDAENATKN